MSGNATTDGQSRNAAISWGLLAIVLASVLESLLEGAILWAGFSAAVVVVAVVPAVVARNPSVLVAWEILLLSALPAIARLFDVFVQPLGYVSVAALALLVVAEINAFTAAKLPPRFAGVFVVLTTLSVACAWGIVRYLSDRLLGTDFLVDNFGLMIDLLSASTVGIVAGVLFALYCSGGGWSDLVGVDG